MTPATMTGAQLRLNQALFLGLGFFATLAAMVPLGLPADSPPMPNLVFALAVAWSIRRPASAPWGSVLAISLLADILLMKPIGLWAIATLAASEFARAQRWQIREQMFVMEWAIFAALFVLALTFHSLMLGIVFLPRPALGLSLSYLITTVIAYPVVVGVLHWIFGVRSPRVAHQSKRLGRIS